MSLDAVFFQEHIFILFTQLQLVLYTELCNVNNQLPLPEYLKGQGNPLGYE